MLNMIEGGGTSYNIAETVIIEGNLDRDKFEGAFKKLVERHEALRTSFEMRDGELVQRVYQKVDFQAGYLEAGEENANDLAEEFLKPFDLSKAPLLRITLVKTGPEKHRLFFDMHHIIANGKSMGILVKELAALYNGEELPGLKIQYKDFSAWQNELFRSEKIKKQEEYWLNTFAGEIPVLNFPTDYPRASLRSFQGDRFYFEAGRKLTENLKNLTVKTGTTLFMALFTAYNILLFKYTGQEDLIVGSPIAGRPHADLARILGMFVNTLALRNFPEGRKTCQEFLGEVKESSLRAYENQDYQFEELVEKLNLERDISRNPLFDTMFALQNMEIEEIKLNSLKLLPSQTENKTAIFDITLTAAETAGGSPSPWGTAPGFLKMKR